MGPSDPTDEEEEGLEYASKQSYMTPPTVPLELKDIITQDALQFSTPPMEEQEGVRECCQTRVVEYVDNLVEIADDERSRGSSSSESSSSLETSLPELEDQENIPPVNFNNVNTIAIPVPPPYAVSGQCAVQSKGVPKSAFHPYCHPLAQLSSHAKAETGRLLDCPSSGQTTPSSSSYSSGGYRVVHSGTTGKSQCGSSGGRGCFLSSSPGGGDSDPSREEGIESLVDLSSRT